MLRNKLFPGKRTLGLALAFVMCSSMPAYAAPDVLPNAGTIADSVKERNIVIPPKVNVQIEVSGEQEEVQPTKEGYKFKVNGYQITGISAVNDLALREDKLQALIKDAANQELTLSELEAVARRITKYFRAQGYMVAKAHIPPQNIVDGIVEIAVVPGKYGSIELRNHSRLADSSARKILNSLKSGSYVKKDKLDRTLLLLSDTDGISIKATLAPGQTTGTSDLIVEITDTDAFTAQLSMDNYGNRFTGKDLRSLSLDGHNVGGIGDEVHLNVNNSGGGLTNAGLSYMTPVGGQGAKVGLGYEQLHYSLGQDFESLNANGTAKNTSIYGMYPIVRSRGYNLYGKFGYTHKELEDRIDEQATFTERHTDVLTLGLTGDSRDKFHGGGINNFALQLSSGHLRIDGGKINGVVSAEENDRLGQQTAGTYTKAKLHFNRLQYINDHVNAYFDFNGQLASKNLDSSEKLYLGGANGVRAYPQGEASGDQGYLITAELRYQTPNPSLQLAAFIDHGHADGSKKYYSAAAEDRTLTGAGLGLIFSKRKDYAFRLDYAWKLTSSEAKSDDDKNGRLWVKGVQYF